MKWIQNFQLFLFDFDGLLVNTEHLHCQAYINMCAQRGFRLNWSFAEFCKVGHIGGNAIQDDIYDKIPELLAQEPNWDVLYQEKKKEYMKLLKTGRVELMPGVKPLLETLANANIRRCVVTNSFKEQIEMIVSFLPILKTIPHWVTREEYTATKPNPECYLRAIQLYAKKGDRIIGFEDSVRGLTALAKTPAFPVLICEKHYPLLDIILDEHAGLRHYESLDLIPSDGLP